MELDTIQTYAYDLRTKHAARDEMLGNMTDMYKLKWSEKEDLERKFAHMKVSLSPTPRNKTKSMVRLMTATKPLPNVPEDLQAKIGPDIGNKIERWADIVLRQSSRVRGNPFEVDVVTSAVLYDEFFISVNSTAAMAQMEGSKATKRRNLDVYRKTPFLFSVHNPIGCYSDHDGIGMTAFARVTEMSPAQIISKYGDAGKAAIDGAVNNKANATNVLGSYKVWTIWTLDWYACWIEGSKTAIKSGPHDMPVIPAVHVIVEGSRDLFDKPEDQREPFLYTLWSSGLWHRENLYLSGMATTAAMALWPQIMFTSDQRKYPDMDMSVPFGVFHLEPGENMQTWSRNLIDPSLQGLWTETQRLSTDSTLYDQAAGAPVGPGASYSETALLNQAGRLPLVGPQRKSGWGMGEALRIGLILYKDEGSWPNTDYEDILDPAEIPDSIEITCDLDVALPQDKLGMANVFNILNDKMPQEWLIENVLGEKNPQNIIRKLMDERAQMVLFQMWVQDKQFKFQAQQQMQMAAMQQQMAPPEQAAAPQAAPQGGAPGGMPPIPPELFAQLQATQGPPSPGLQGLPPEMLQGGQIMPPDQEPTGEEPPLL